MSPQTSTLYPPGGFGAPKDRHGQADGIKTGLPEGTVVFSADNHISIADDIFYNRFPDELKENAPRIWYEDGAYQVGRKGQSFLPGDFSAVLMQYDGYQAGNFPQRVNAAFADEMLASGYAVLGVSMDTPESHQRFGAGHGLGFPLISDRDASICKAYGVARLGGWLPPKRVTFVIDREGVVRKVITGELNTPVADVALKLQELKERYASEATISHLDGVSVDGDGWHFNVRPSNTEPLLRLNLEARSEELMEQKRDEVLALIRA